MPRTYLQQCTAAAENVALHLFDQSFAPDVIEQVLTDVEQRFPKIYQAAVDERGKATVHQQMAKRVKKALGADNAERASSSDGAPCQTHQRLNRRP